MCVCVCVCVCVSVCVCEWLGAGVGLWIGNNIMKFFSFLYITDLMWHMYIFV